MDAEKES